MTRRTLLATAPTAAILGLAGCIGHSSGASNSSTTGTDTSHGGGGGGGGGQVGEGHAPNAQLKMEAVSTADITAHMTMTVSKQTNHADLVSELAQNGSTTIQATSEPLSTRRPISYQGTVYNVSSEVTGQTAATQYTIAFADASSPDSSNIVKYSALPAVDQRKLAAAGFKSGPSVGVATTLTYTDAEQSKSVLVPSPSQSVIQWENNGNARITIKNQSPITIHTYRYTAKNVGSEMEYGNQVKSQYGFSLKNLSSDEADIVSTAIQQDSGYSVAHGQTPPGAFHSLAQQFSRHQPVSTSSAPSPSGDYIVTYQGTTYWTSLLDNTNDTTTN
ncbi:MAG: hypothetical protein ABEI98_12470 [Halorhabdus sp.]